MLLFLKDSNSFHGASPTHAFTESTVSATMMDLKTRHTHNHLVPELGVQERRGGTCWWFPEPVKSTESQLFHDQGDFGRAKNSAQNQVIKSLRLAG